jgi:hypothetical protein
VETYVVCDLLETCKGNLGKISLYLRNKVQIIYTGGVADEDAILASLNIRSGAKQLKGNV